MKRVLKRATIKEIISNTTSTHVTRDYQAEYDFLVNKTGSDPFSYHNLELSSFDSIDIDINDLAEWISMRKNYSIHEDPITGEPAIYKNQRVKEYLIKLSFSYNKKIQEVTVALELNTKSRFTPHEGTKIWIIISTDQDDLVVERVYI